MELTSFQFSFISVLFPFLGPVFDKMNLSFFPADVLQFFYGFLETIKTDRQKSQQKSVSVYRKCLEAQSDIALFVFFTTLNPASHDAVMWLFCESL